MNTVYAVARAWKFILFVMVAAVGTWVLARWSLRANTFAPIAIAVFVATAIPISLLLMRDYVRVQRRRILQGLFEKFCAHGGSLPAAAHSAVEWACLKYGVSLPVKGETPAEKAARQAEEDAATRTGDRREAAKRAALLWSSIPYLVFSMGGFVLLFETLSLQLSGLQLGGGGVKDRLDWLLPMLHWPTNLPVSDPRGIAVEFLNSAQIASAAFAGAYLFTLRFLFKSVLNLELSTFSFVRAAIHLLTGVVIGVLVYRTLRSVGWNGQHLPTASWVALAFFAGYIPDFFLTTLVRKLQIFGLKSANDEFLKAAQITPLELIDGIDYDIRYRFEENNISDVQNLATYNPLVLYAETPYGLYQIFDWVLQAQLCILVGPDALIKLRKFGIRTVLDLEAAGAEDVPNDYLRLIGCLMFPRDEACRKIKLDVEKATADLAKANADATKADAELMEAKKQAQAATGEAKAKADAAAIEAQKAKDAAGKTVAAATTAKQHAETAKTEFETAIANIEKADAAIAQADADLKKAQADADKPGDADKQAAAQAKTTALKAKADAEKAKADAERQRDRIEQTQTQPLKLEPDTIRFVVRSMCDDPYVKGLIELWGYLNGLQPAQKVGPVIEDPSG